MDANPGELQLQAGVVQYQMIQAYRFAAANTVIYFDYLAIFNITWRYPGLEEGRA